MALQHPLNKHTYQFAAEPVHSSNLNEIQDAVVELQTEINCLVLSKASFSSLPQTFTDSRITTDMVCIKAELGTPSAQTGNWTVNTNTAGQAVVSGTISGSTTLTLYLVHGRT